MSPDDILTHNRTAWDRAVHSGNEWTIPVTPETIEAARRGEWSVVLTPAKPVPRAWFGELEGAEVLGLASAGGQQCPILAAAGARVTVFDNSPAQLGRDREVAEREGLSVETVLGDMADLSAFDDASFDLVFHPVSNCFVPDVLPVWREAFRVLRPGGALLAGFANPIIYAVDYDTMVSEGRIVVENAIPWADSRQPRALVDAHMEAGETLEFGHTLEDQLGGQLAAGFVLVDLFEDTDLRYPLGKLIPTFIATRALKPSY